MEPIDGNKDARDCLHACCFPVEQMYCINWGMQRPAGGSLVKDPLCLEQKIEFCNVAKMPIYFSNLSEALRGPNMQTD